MLISPEYLKQQHDLHADGDYGTSSSKWAGMICDLANANSFTSILDYGCGKGLLKKSLQGANIAEYDPCIEGKDSPPASAELVVCTDVLEHIEPDCLDNVLDHLQSLTMKTGFFVIATRPAKKILSDGRNAHLIQQPHEWWLPKIFVRWKLKAFRDFGGCFMLIVEKK